MHDLLLRDVRLVDLDGAGTQAEPVDVLVLDGVVAQVGPRPATREGRGGNDVPEHAIPVLEGAGRWAVPGLWDHHVHLQQWGLTRARLDLSAAGSVEDALETVRGALASGSLPPTGVLTGFGHRSATWAEQPTRAALDGVTGEVPVVLISADCHHGWLNGAALHRLGLPPGDGVVCEAEWFRAYDLLTDLPGSGTQTAAAVSAAVRDALARGVVGVTDLEFGRPWELWRDRHEAGGQVLRARVGVYPEHLQHVLDAGARTGGPVAGTGGLVTMGPLKIISDGSLNTRTAWCHQPYADGHLLAHPRGAANHDAAQVRDLLATATGAGLEVALHAIGDAAVHQALVAFAQTGARGGIEHAQLVDPADLPLWAGLPVRASVQPAHLLDDRAVTEQCWPDRADRTFTLRSFLDHGIELVLGSDAPVAPLDPWLAMAAAVHRGPVEEDSWHPEQALTPREALAASVDGRRLCPGAPGDVVLLDADPLAPAGMPSREQARALRSASVSATVLAGQLVHGR
ncbi:amidohydrolase [Ornithinimicrobium avium]|uniref:Hydrolase n=1 Tax=Ornithinimicrobium avium TaxID=2283195 RepID=A0A345NM53_9MICO|nr:amidohydrolase family protein [Ornithinimicrobium avium]AXH96111.1 hydrolase [Ornithinimicrobium avium]